MDSTLNSPLFILSLSHFVFLGVWKMLLFYHRHPLILCSVNRLLLLLSVSCWANILFSQHLAFKVSRETHTRWHSQQTAYAMIFFDDIPLLVLIICVSQMLSWLFGLSLFMQLITSLNFHSSLSSQLFVTSQQKAQTEVGAFRLLLQLSNAAFSLVWPVFVAALVWVFFLERCSYSSGVSIILSIVQAPVASPRSTVFLSVWWQIW